MISYSVSDIIVSDYGLVGLLLFSDLLYFLVDCVTILVCQKYGTDISTLNIIEFCPIFLLPLECLLMLLNKVVFIVIYRTCGKYSELGSLLTHGLRVNIVPRVRILLQPSIIDEAVEVFSPSLVYQV